MPFEPQNYKDTYREELETLIEEKAQHIERKPPEKQVQRAQVIDLMVLLKESLKKEQKKAA
ncbi:MAG: hypothetical protein A2X80_01280 [Geobacteraceae bacterium GWB2_52_12]|nr:MAG: hypothetical protein A2X80_01280 [Geobacteraceae bacterium GWB2_52_12]